MRTLIALFLLIGSAQAEDFKTKEAIAAEKKYEDALDAAQKAYDEATAKARADYLAELDAAAKTAVDAEKLDEVVRIKRAKDNLSKEEQGDPIVAARKRVMGKRYTFNRPGSPNQLHFLAGGKVRVKTGGSGVWEMVEPNVGVMKLGRGGGKWDIFLFRFDKSFTKFEILAYVPTKTKYTVGRKVRY